MNKLTEDDIFDAGFYAGSHIDKIEDDETGEVRYGFINEDGYVDNVAFLNSQDSSKKK